MPPEPTSDQWVEIDGLPIPAQAWKVVSLKPLWHRAQKRGRDRPIPGAAGVRAYPRRPTVTRRVLELIVYGHVDVSGNPSGDPSITLEDNLEYLNSHLVDAPATADGTRTAILHLPSGLTRTAQVHVVELAFADLGVDAVRGVLDLSIPSGALE